MKYFLTFLLSISLLACKEAKDDNGKWVKNGIQTITQNGCQYVIYKNSSRGACAMVHAGNCNNPVHQNQSN